MKNLSVIFWILVIFALFPLGVLVVVFIWLPLVLLAGVLFLFFFVKMLVQVGLHGTKNRP